MSAQIMEIELRAESMRQAREVIEQIAPFRPCQFLWLAMFIELERNEVEIDAFARYGRSDENGTPGLGRQRRVHAEMEVAETGERDPAVALDRALRQVGAGAKYKIGPGCEDLRTNETACGLGCSDQLEPSP